MTVSATIIITVIMPPPAVATPRLLTKSADRSIFLISVSFFTSYHRICYIWFNYHIVALFTIRHAPLSTSLDVARASRVQRKHLCRPVRSVFCSFLYVSYEIWPFWWLQLDQPARCKKSEERRFWQRFLDVVHSVRLPSQRYCLWTSSGRLER